MPSFKMKNTDYDVLENNDDRILIVNILRPKWLYDVAILSGQVWNCVCVLDKPVSQTMTIY